MRRHSLIISLKRSSISPLTEALRACGRLPPPAPRCRAVPGSPRVVKQGQTHLRLLSAVNISSAAFAALHTGAMEGGAGAGGGRTRRVPARLLSSQSSFASFSDLVFFLSFVSPAQHLSDPPPTPPAALFLTHVSHILPPARRMFTL